MTKRSAGRASYPLDQSPLFRLANKRRLSELLRIGLADLFAVTKHPPYKRWQTSAKFPSARSEILRAHKPRWIQQALSPLDGAQKRIAVLLSRIETPEYLYSARKGRSYRDNAIIHRGRSVVIRIDIRKFYESASSKRVEGFFLDELKCSKDIAYLLGRLTTLDGHLPTGSAASPIISFFAYRSMFDRCAATAKKFGAEMTVYVDDVVFSGVALSGNLIQEVLGIFREYDLYGHKIEHYRGGRVPVVTGVALPISGPTLPNKRWRKIRALEQELVSAPTPRLRSLYAKSLVGQYREGSAMIPALRLRAEQIASTIRPSELRRRNRTRFRT